MPDSTPSKRLDYAFARLRELSETGLIVYITAVHLPMLAEARYSLPAKPVVLALAAIALAELAHRILPQTGDYLP